MSLYCKAAGLNPSEIADGLVVFDRVKDRVHFLNRTSAVIFELTEGKLPASEIAAHVAAVFGLPEPPLDGVQECLDSLVREGLVELC